MERTGAGGQPALRRVMGPGLLLVFIVGDILGTGVYALTGKVAAQVGGVAWLTFLLAFGVAVLTAASYLELVTKYPTAGGAAAYAHRAFRVQALTYLVTFAVMASGLTSAASAALAFAGNLTQVIPADGLPDHVRVAEQAHGVGGGQLSWLDSVTGNGLLVGIALAFILAVAAINLRGISESVRLNVVLTAIEVSGLLLVIGIGVWALSHGHGDLSRLTQVETSPGESPVRSITAATALAFFAFVGFEDSVNMAEETRDPARVFPRIMFAGLAITGVIYLLVVAVSVSVVPPEVLGSGETPLLTVVAVGAPAFPLWIFALITMAAVANSALINMLMASRLLYGMAGEKVLPSLLGRVLPGRRTPWVAICVTTLLAVLLIAGVDLASLGGTTSLLLLAVFAVTNCAVLVLRRSPVEHRHFRAPTVIPVAGLLSCVFLASPWSGRPAEDYRVAALLLLAGVGLWLLRVVMSSRSRRRRDEHARRPTPDG
ncbi:MULTISPECIES: APC family permease [unclassified Dietzia]|uniref:APC family permease n=1 Tax=unclassified Dietzia TaxID=2617939 RepID=UPI0018D2395B|nr:MULTISPECIES: APC family permease [unclassified Dietzia]